MSRPGSTNDDNRSYYRFTAPHRVEKSLNTLKGLLIGVAADGLVAPEERDALARWCSDNSDVMKRHPFNELADQLKTVIESDSSDVEDVRDVIWLCDQYAADNPRFDVLTTQMQELQGIVSGIVSDGVIVMSELERLGEWMDERQHLKPIWPFAEIEALCLEVMRDGQISDDEHRMLLTFFGEFLSREGHRVVEVPLNELDAPISGLCAVCPEVVIVNRLFCFTGKSQRSTRTKIADTVERLGGTFSNNVTQKTHYLVIGADGNDAWAFCCYGRKVEQAIQMRKAGSDVLIVHEVDFWDAVQDYE